MNKYRVLIVDDEPAALQLLSKVIKLKCPDFEVAATAEDGLQALQALEENTVDVVMTDIRMPGMDGIALASKIKEEYPLIYTVVISGYQEFEYVKGALQASVQDYLLKPVNPQEIQKLFSGLKLKLDNVYYEKRNRFLRYVSQGMDSIDLNDLKMLFPAREYYAAIIRKNSVISRFNMGKGFEIYSGEEEQLIIYGRDDNEMLYLCEKDMITDFEAVMEREFQKFQKTQEENGFLTMVRCPEAFSVSDMVPTIQDLFKTLDHSIVTGKEQKILLGGKLQKKNTEKSEIYFDRLIYLIKKKDILSLQNELCGLFTTWEEEGCTQFWMEGKLRYLLYEMRNQNLLKDWNEYWLEDAFLLATSMDDLCESIEELIRQNADYNKSSNKYEKELLFQNVVDYIKTHLREDLPVQRVCQELGISQAALTRLFRTYAETSYKNYLIVLRIEEAKTILSERPDSFIKDVAEYVGFNDQFYFSRVFRSVTGMSPSEYIDKVSK